MCQIRGQLSVAAVSAQCPSLLGRLEVIGSGLVEAAGRRARALDVSLSGGASGLPASESEGGFELVE